MPKSTFTYKKGQFALSFFGEGILLLMGV